MRVKNTTYPAAPRALELQGYKDGGTRTKDLAPPTSKILQSWPTTLPAERAINHVARVVDMITYLFLT
jgi:hypothetical protein